MMIDRPIEDVFDRLVNIDDYSHWLGLAMMESRPRYRLQPVNGRTTVHHFAVGELYGLFRILEPYVALHAQSERKRTVEKLKESLEAKTR